MEWESFAEALAEELAVLPAGALIVISEPGDGLTGRYAQFVQETDRLVAEVVADSVLEPKQRVSAEGERAITSAGWRPPDRPAGRENWWAELAWPASARQYQALAGMVVTAMRDGYGIPDPGGLRYRAWNEKKGNDPFDLPRLGLPREEPRRARLFDGEGADGRPHVSRPPVDAGERDRLLAYLQKAPIVLAARGFDSDRLEPGGRRDVPMTFHTDGAWVWPGAVGYYLREHDVAPEPDLVDHVRRMEFRLPEVDERARAAALSVVTGPTGSAPARRTDQAVRRAAPGRASGGRSTTPGRAPASSDRAGAAGEEDSIRPLPGEPPLSLLKDRRVVGLPVDAEVDRYGDPDGNFMYAVRTPYARRSWPAEWENRPYRVYRLRRPLRVLTGVAVPWFDQPGGGIAYVLPSSVADLLADGTLTEVTGA